MKHLLVVLALLLLFPVSAHAATYYVSPSGSDSASGAESSPWRTLQKAATSLVAGDTVYLRAGTYNEQLKPQNSGSSGAYISFISYPGEQAIIDGTSVSLQWSGLVDITARSYIKISGLRIQNSVDDGIYVLNSNHIILENNHTYNSVQSGIGIWLSNNVIADGNEIELANNLGPNENISIDGSYAVEVKNNNVHNGPANPSGGEGINVKNGSYDVKIHHNTVHGLNRLAFGLDGWEKYTHDIEYYNNVAYNCAYGFVIESEQGGTVENVKVYNNIAYNNQGPGFDIPNWMQNDSSLKKNVEFINNTAYGNETGISIISTAVENITLRNNIFSQNRGSSIYINPSVQSQVTADHNLTSGDPLYLNSSGGDFRLNSNSPAIDTGSSQGAPVIDFDGISRPQGSTYDIGAYEFLNSNSTPTPSSTPLITPTPTSTTNIIPGDANADGFVNNADYLIWKSYYRQSTNQGFTNADFDNNNVVDGVDYIIWLNNEEN